MSVHCVDFHVEVLTPKLTVAKRASKAECRYRVLSGNYMVTIFVQARFRRRVFVWHSGTDDSRMIDSKPPLWRLAGPGGPCRYLNRRRTSRRLQRMLNPESVFVPRSPHKTYPKQRQRAPHVYRTSVSRDKSGTQDSARPSAQNPFGEFGGLYCQ